MKIMITTLMISVVAILIGWNYSKADEVVICLSEENQYAVLMDEKGQCTEDETEFVTSGSRVERNEKALPMVISYDNESCEQGLSGTITQLGFDKDDDGELGEDEILTTSGWCAPAGEEEDKSDSEG